MAEQMKVAGKGVEYYDENFIPVYGSGERTDWIKITTPIVYGPVTKPIVYNFDPDIIIHQDGANEWYAYYADDADDRDRCHWGTTQLEALQALLRRT